MIEQLETHILQSPEWGEFKRRMGTPSVSVGGIQFTKHKIPFLPFYVGYAPKVNFARQKLSWKEFKEIAKNERCAFIRFDVPNVLKSTSENSSSSKIVEELEKYCKKSPKSTMTKYNVLLDLSCPEEVLSQNLHQKTRYNIRLADKKGVEIKVEDNENGIETFLELNHETAKRQGFLLHPDKYYREAYETLHKYGMADILIAYYENKPLVAWILCNYKGVLYYPYGGSSNENREVMASNLMAWEAIKFGKKIGCNLFDMWGATNDRKHTYWGFTQFKIRNGGELVEYIDSYDFVVNPFVYFFFNLSYKIFWGLKGIIFKIKG